MTASATLLEDGRLVRVIWPDGVRRDLSARWLFDHAKDARDPVSGQRGHGALALADAHALATEVEGDRLRARFSPSGAERWIGLDRLRGEEAPAAHPVQLWPTPGPIAAAPPIPFDDYMSDDDALREALSRVVRRGLALLVGAGEDPDAAERVVARFGFVRETNYGRLFDVRIEPRPGNLASTDRALDLHTDNPYRDPAPTLQLLHAIATDDAGGATLFVDGFAHAEALRRASPDAFDRLARTPARFTFAAAGGERWSCETPVLRLRPDSALESVRLNHRSLDLPPVEAEAVEAWYDAYLAFYRRLHAPEAPFERRLAPGELVIFDNRRILHGRRGLVSGSPRWLRGCYADVDGLGATLARLDQTIAQETDDANNLCR
jgi:gamma-butyrobetaine dioxygenase